MKFTKFSNPFHPGEILQEEFLDAKGISQISFSKKMDPEKTKRDHQGQKSGDRPVRH